MTALPHYFALPVDTAATTTLLGHRLAAPGAGVAGTPVPYAIHADDALTLALLLAFVVSALLLAARGPALARQARSFAFGYQGGDPGGDAASAAACAPALRPLHLLAACTCCLLVGIALYLAATELMRCRLASGCQTLPVALFATLAGACLAVRRLLAWLVNEVFFGSRKARLWAATQQLLTTAQTALFFPLVLLQVYSGMSVRNTLLGCAFVVFFGKILSFYKSWSIFFRRNGRFLQNILYFCTLELTPLLVFGGLWLMSVRYLESNYF